MSPRTPPRAAFTPAERRLIATLHTPRQVQRFLREFPYNWEKTLRTFRGVVASGRAHCLEAVLFSATVLEQHGYPALALDLESQDGLDHVLFIYREEYYDAAKARAEDKEHTAEIRVAKHRNGPVADLEMFFHKEHGRFRDLDRRHASAAGS